MCLLRCFYHFINARRLLLALLVNTSETLQKHLLYQLLQEKRSSSVTVNKTNENKIGVNMLCGQALRLRRSKFKERERERFNKSLFSFSWFSLSKEEEKSLTLFYFLHVDCTLFGRKPVSHYMYRNCHKRALNLSGASLSIILQKKLWRKEKNEVKPWRQAETKSMNTELDTTHNQSQF